MTEKTFVLASFSAFRQSARPVHFHSHQVHRQAFPGPALIAIESEVFGSCVEGIRVEVGGKVLRMVLVCPGIFRFGAQCLTGSVVRLR